jgi:CheY-like chemotaxis protein
MLLRPARRLCVRLQTPDPEGVSLSEASNSFRPSAPAGIVGDAEQLARTRHDLRNCANHVLSYAQLAQEEAEEHGLDALAESIRKLRAPGLMALDLIATAFGTGVDVSAMREARLALRAFGHRTSAEAVALAELASTEGLEPAAADLQHVAQACTELDLLLDQAEHSALEDLGDQQGATAERGQPEGRLAAPEDATPRSVPDGAAVVLVVDDDAGNRDVLVRNLARLGLATLTAQNGSEALDVLSRSGVDVVLLDILMPVKNGYEVLEARQASAELRDIPFIVISAVDDIQSVVRCVEMGAEDYLPKPFDPILLRARVGACLEKKRFRDQEVAYLRDVALLTAAAATVEGRTFNPESRAERSIRNRSPGWRFAMTSWASSRACSSAWPLASMRVKSATRRSPRWWPAWPTRSTRRWASSTRQVAFCGGTLAPSGSVLCCGGPGQGRTSRIWRRRSR